MEHNYSKTQILNLSQRRLHTAVVDSQSEFLGSGQLALSVKVAVKLGVVQGGLERLDLLPIRPGEGLLDFGQGPSHLNKSNRHKQRP